MSENNLTQITATVLPQTKESIEGICDTSGLSVGEIIDRMALKMHAKDAEHAAQLILDSMITYTRNLSSDEFNKAIWIVLSVIKESLSVNEPEAILKVIQQIESTLPFEA